MLRLQILSWDTGRNAYRKEITLENLTELGRREIRRQAERLIVSIDALDKPKEEEEEDDDLYDN